MKALVVAVALGACGLLVACGGGPTPAETSSTAARPALAAASDLSGCDVRARSDGGGPVNDPNGPYYHRVVLAHTRDGLSLSGDVQVLDHASVPDGVKLADGSVMVYYVNGAAGGVWVARVSGDAATPIGPITINGIVDPVGIVDPDATLMPDGKVRLVYFASTAGAPPTDPVGSTICIADSNDGTTFTVVARAIHFDTLTTDPTMVRLADGSWLLAGSQGRTTVLAKSSDGLAFSQTATLDYGGVAELSLTSDGAVRMYTCNGGFATYRSTDRGATWTPEARFAAGIRAKIVCDPSRVAGTDLFFYKTAS